jgi:hypothetical protein
MFLLSFLLSFILIFCSFCFLLLGQLTNSAPADTFSHTSHVVSDPLDNPPPLLGDVYPFDESLPLSGEESSLLEPEHPQEAEETHLSNVRRVVITSMCHASPFSMCW